MSPEDHKTLKQLKHLVFILTILLFSALGYIAGNYQKKETQAAGPVPEQPPRERVDEKPKPTPRYMEPDFGKHSAIFLACGPLFKICPDALVKIVKTVTPRIQIIAFVAGPKEGDQVRQLFKTNGISLKNISFLHADLETPWIRDYGPFFVRTSDNRTILLDADYSNIDSRERWRDNDFPIMLASRLGTEIEQIPLRIEGGNFLTNGDGLVVSTTAIIDRNYQRGYDVQKIANMFHTYFGAREWVYVTSLEGEPFSHIDTMMNFLDVDVAVVAEIDKESHPDNAATLDETARLIASIVTSRGTMKVHRIPMPPVSENGYWRSYCNIILVNGAILVPTYSDVDPALQQKALDVYRKLMPDWEVVGVNVDELVPMKGLLHCVSLHVPWFFDTRIMGRHSLHPEKTD